MMKCNEPNCSATTDEGECEGWLILADGARCPDHRMTESEKLTYAAVRMRDRFIAWLTVAKDDGTEIDASFVLTACQASFYVTVEGQRFFVAVRPEPAIDRTAERAGRGDGPLY